MRRALVWAVAATLAAACDKDRPPARPTPQPVAVADAPPATAVTDAAAPGAFEDVAVPGMDGGAPAAGAGGPHVFRLVIRNVGRTPMRLLTNPDTNELIHVHRAVSGPAYGPRVAFFPIGQMPLCSEDAGVGYGGLGQPQDITLEPGGTYEVARWDGRVRREINDRTRGVCAEETPAPNGRYRFVLDQPSGRPTCNDPVVRIPFTTDAGDPVVELLCRRG